MPSRDHFFVSYSAVDGKDVALDLADQLVAGPPPIPVWIDKRKLRPGEDWDEQIVEAIRNCKGLIFVMTRDSVQPESVCKDEWVRALKYKKPVIPLLAERDAELPFRLGSREYIDFTGSSDAALARLRLHLEWMSSPEGQLQQMKYRLADAQRELPRAQPDQQARIKEDIAELERQIAQQQAVLDNPGAAQQRVQERVEHGLELIREPAKAVTALRRAKFVNPPPTVAPTWFQNRHVESELVGDFLKEEALRLMTIVGRGGIGKSAMVCRLLKSVEAGQLPDDRGPLSVDGIVYLSNARSFHRITVPELYAGLTQLLPDDLAARLDVIYKNPQAGPAETMQALLQAFATGRTLVLLDNFEDALDGETAQIKSAELYETLRALLELPSHGLKVIITTRVAPADLAAVEPGRQRRLDLEHGLDSPFAENVLRAMDRDGRLGLKDAPDALLALARERTRGNPRALEHLFGILSADRDTTLKEILEDTKRLLPGQVVEVLVGEAFNRLDVPAQRVMQALAAYRYPVSPVAVDYLLQPYVPGVDSAPVLKRLVNMQFARREAGRYYVHQLDRDYALTRIPEANTSEPGALTRIALTRRAADWFKQTRKPREEWKTLDDLAPQLSEYELRISGDQYDEAAAVLLEVDFNYLQLWGHFRLAAELESRLQGNISDPRLDFASALTLGIAYYRMGQYQQAIACEQRALSLAREHGFRSEQAFALGNLALDYAELGFNERSIQHHEEALAIYREVGDRGGEATTLDNLANQYSQSGELAKCVEYRQLALAIDRELADQRGEAHHLTNLAHAFRNLGDFDKALRCLADAHRIACDISYRVIEMGSLSGMADVYFTQGNLVNAADKYKVAIELADASSVIQFQCEARIGLASTLICKGELAAAHQAADVAMGFDFPLSNDEALLTVGTVALLERDCERARDALSKAVRQADELLARNSRKFTSLDCKGLAACGLALCDNVKHVQIASEAFAAARAIVSAPGAVMRVLRIFDALALADTTGLLQPLRPVAAGGTMTASTILQ